MSLQAWYPLDGNLKNYGVGQLTPTTTTAPVYIDGGKVSVKALSTGGFKWTAAQSASILNNEAISIAFWIKPLNTTTGQIFGTSGMSANNNRKFAIFAYPTGNDLHLSWMNDAASTTFMGGVWTGVFPVNTWTHCCITYDNPTAKIYINGILKETKTGISNSSSFNYETPVIHSSANRYINDFRVYDHCLNPREVKELAQGLVLHYKLNANNANNLLTNSYKLNGKSTSVDPTFGYPVCNADNSAGTSYKDFLSWGGFPVNINEKYTVSFYAKSTTSSTLTMYFYNNTSGVVQVSNIKSSEGHNKSGSDGNCPLTLTPQWKKYWVTWTFNSSGTSANKTLLFRLSAGGKCDVALPKFERGIIATPYAPKLGETCFNPAEDCSGYGRHGTTVGTISLSTDSVRYSTSCEFDGSTTGINLPIKDLMKTVLKDKCTVNFWAKDFDTSSRSIFFGGYSGSNFNIEQNGTSFRVYWAGNPDIQVSGVTANEWAMWTVTTDITTGIKIYKDGVLIKTHAAALTDITSNFTRDFNIGKDSRTDSTMMEGLMSDFRIYASVLSADDIALLYNSAIAMINNGSIQAYEFIEEPDVFNIKFTQQGALEAGDISEIGYIGGMKVKTLPDKSAWARIFYHKNVGGTVLFTTYDEVMNTNTEYKFSRLDLLDHFICSDNKFEFLLNYTPVDTSLNYSNKYNRWKQSSNPCNEYMGTSDSSLTATGYEAIHIDFNTNYWGGLTRQNSSATSISSCFLSGSVGHGNWFHAIGAKSSWNNGIPGPGVAVEETELWVKISDLTLLNKISMLDNEYIQAFDIYEI